MSTHRLFVLALYSLAGFAVFVGSNARAGSLLQNGSFEEAKNQPPPGGFISLYAGSRDMRNWLVSSGSIDLVGTYWVAADGTNSVDLTGAFPGSIQQTFATIPGQQYQVTFSLAGNPVGPPAIKKLKVHVAKHCARFEFDTTGHTQSDMGWVTESFTFRATHDTSSLMFADQTRTDVYGVVLDNVSVSQVIGIAINPEASQNSVNLTHDGEIRVVIMSDSGFDAIAGLDTTSLKFGPSGNEAPPFFCNPSGEDINGDGLRDLACYFDSQETGFQVGDTEGTLKGKTTNGVDISGTAPVQIVLQ